MIPGIVLAAGASRRFAPHHKLLQPYQSHAIIHHGLKAALDSDLSQVILIVGHRGDEVVEALGELNQHPKLLVLHNSNWQTGRASTLRLGLDNLNETVEGVLVYPGDMPLISTPLINDLIEAFQPRLACFPLYNQRKGHPVIFPSTWFEDLKNLEGEQSALELIKTQWDTAIKLERTDIETQMNVNTPRDYEALLQYKEPSCR